MIPGSSANTSGVVANKIYVNPNFRNPNPWPGTQPVPHINPMFLIANRTNSIHMNPEFLRKQKENTAQQNAMNVNIMPPQLTEAFANRSAVLNDCPQPVIQNQSSLAKIIQKSRTKIVRKHANISSTAPIKRTLHTNVTATSSCPPPTRTYDSRKNIENNENLYSVSRYSLKRKPLNVTKAKALPKSSGKFQPNFNKKLLYLTINGVLYKCNQNKLQRNDAAAKSTTNYRHNKFEKKFKAKTNNFALKKTSLASATASFRSRSLFVRGAKFIMDERGYKLTRLPMNDIGPNGIRKAEISNQMVPTTMVTKRNRIDIGGMTFVRSSANDVYVRTHTHLALAHLNRTKHRSLMMLNRNLVKSNLPCPIYQRLGKCAAYERGRCNKTHNKQNVCICPKFIKGKCSNVDCLLSHDVSFAKMPVCIFYLQGICLRDNCPYLHKKLSSDAPTCEDFVRGYCKLADKCEKRHEFPHEKAKQKQQQQQQLLQQRAIGSGQVQTTMSKGRKPKDRTTPEVSTKSQDDANPYVRYYLGICSNSNNNTANAEIAANLTTETANGRVNASQHDQGHTGGSDHGDVNEEGNHEYGCTIYRPARSKLPDTLPAFIPFS